MGACKRTDGAYAERIQYLFKVLLRQWSNETFTFCSAELRKLRTKQLSSDNASSNVLKYNCYTGILWETIMHFFPKRKIHKTENVKILHVGILSPHVHKCYLPVSKDKINA